MAIDSRYVTGFSLEQTFVDKSTGLPLSNGTIEFWEDDDRGVPKLVYQLSGSPPNYTYTALPNPITLSAVGTIQNAGGDNIALYAFPYDSDDDDALIQLYYVVVKDENGVNQFTREAWPNTTDGSSSGSGGGEGRVNQILNPQFVDVLFDPSETLTISFSGSSTTTVDIAPEWFLEIVHTGAGTVQVTRTSVVGQSRYPSNPPYTLDFVASSNITSLRLIQRLDNNPDIFAPTTSGVFGYVSGGILLSNGTAASLIYSPSVGTDQVILTESNATGSYEQYNETIQLALANNTQDSDDGYVDIIIDLPILGSSSISNVQIVSLDTNDQNVQYEQTSVNYQKSQLLNYYNPLLQYKETPSYLVGWDFPLNPAQPLGDTVAATAIGANKSKYVWDQTIIFQSADSGVGITRATSGAMVTTAAATTQLALIQYLPATIARKILNDACSVNISALASTATQCRVSLWYTTDANLPDVSDGTNNSIVLTLGSTGNIATTNGTWVQVTRNNLGDSPSFTIGTSSTTNFNDYSFSNFNINGIAGASTATFFAIVVSTEEMAMSDTISWNSISLVPGDIPCRPAPQTQDQVIKECEYYYEKSYAQGVAPGTVSALSALSAEQNYLLGGASYLNFRAGQFGFVYKNVKRSSAPDIVLYSPSATTANRIRGYIFNNGAVDTSADLATTSWTQEGLGDKAVHYIGNSAADLILGTSGGPASAPETYLLFHYSVDARLGIV